MPAVPPALSIVTPCLNRAGFLVRTLESVASQRAASGSVEHLIVDGGSTDGSVEVIRRHAGAYPDLVTEWMSEPDAGQSDAINKGFARARGEWGGWLNADDWYEPGALEAVLESVRGDPSIDVLVGRARFVDEDGRVVFAPQPPEPVSPASLLRLKSRWFNGRSLVQPEVFFRLSLFRAVGGLNVRNHYSMDHELWLALLARGARVAMIDRHLASIGVHAGQKTRNNRAAVRSLLVHSFEHLEAQSASLGIEVMEIRSELDSMRRKLELGDLVLRCWDRVLEVSSKPGGVHYAGAYDGIKSRDDEIGSRLRGLEADADSLHGSIGTQAIRCALKAAPRGALRALVVCRAGSTIPRDLVREVGRRPLGLSVSTFNRAALAELVSGAGVPADEAWHRVAGTTIGSEMVDGPGTGEAFDLIVTDGVLMRFLDPRAVLCGLWAWLGRAGVLAQLAEPRPVSTLEPYLAWLRERMARQLSANDDVTLDRRADAFLERFRLDAAATERLRPGVDDLWLAAHVGCRGIEVEELIAAGAPGCQRVRAWSYGSLSFHPLAPFPFVGPRDLGAQDAWFTSVWRKPA